MLLSIIISLIVVVVIAIATTLYLLTLNVAGLNFLYYVQDILEEEDEQDELKDLRENGLPFLMETLSGVKSMLYFALLTLAINLSMVIFIIEPELQTTSIWFALTIAAALMNASVIVSFRSFFLVRDTIEGTCGSYNILLDSLNHIIEYKDNNDRSN